MFSPVVRRWPPPVAAASLLAAACASPIVSAESRVRSVVPTSPAPAPTALAAAPGASAEPRPEGVEWRLHLGTALPVAPAVAEDGTVYAGTGDGALVGIGAEGTLRFSYTLGGAVASCPVVDASDRIVVATTAGWLYSILPSGKLGWAVRTPSPTATDVVLSPRWGLLFGGRDGSLWAFSLHGAALWHTPVGGLPAAAPGFHDTRTAIATTEGDVVALDGASKRFRTRLAGRPEGAPVVEADGSVSVIVGGVLYGLGSRGDITYRLEGIRHVSDGEGGLLAVGVDNSLMALDRAAAPTWRVPLGFVASAAAVRGPNGVIYVAGDGGELGVVTSDRAVRVLRLGRAALKRPAVDAPRRRVVVASGAGEVFAVRVPGA